MAETVLKDVRSDVEKTSEKVEERTRNLKETVGDGLERIGRSVKTADSTRLKSGLARHPYLWLGGTLLVGIALGVIVAW